jgi:hypothetical protein
MFCLGPPAPKVLGSDSKKHLKSRCCATVKNKLGGGHLKSTGLNLERNLRLLQVVLDLKLEPAIL